MGSISTQDLNLRPHAMHAMTDFMSAAGKDQLEHLIAAFNQEKDKIEVFKRELPLTMHLLADGQSLAFSLSSPSTIFSYLFPVLAISDGWIQGGAPKTPGREIQGPHAAANRIDQTIRPSIRQRPPLREDQLDELRSALGG